MTAKKTPKLTYARAFDIILHNRNIKPGEKLVLLEVCRYWPKAYHGSNSTISYNTGLCTREVQYCLKALSTGPKKRAEQHKPPRRAYINRGYAHIRIQGKRYTARMILPLCLPGKAEPPSTPPERDFTRQQLRRGR